MPTVPYPIVDMSTFTKVWTIALRASGVVQAAVETFARPERAKATLILVKALTTTVVIAKVNREIFPDQELDSSWLPNQEISKSSIGVFLRSLCRKDAESHKSQQSCRITKSGRNTRGEFKNLSRYSLAAFGIT